MFGRFYFIFLIVFLVSVSATQLGVSPAKVELNLSIDEEKCFDIEIYSDRLIELEMEDFWSEKYSRNLEDYNLKGKNMNYESNFVVNGKLKREICIIGDENLNKHGVLMAYSKDKKIGVGVWIKVNLDKEDKVFYSSIPEEENVPNFNILTIFSSELLLILTLFMLVKKVYI
jgi:hypothetical protein